MTADRLAPELNPLDQIQFVDDHRVGLEAGDYQIDLQQNVFANDTLRGPSPNTAFTQTGYFSVLCEQYQLHPQTIHAVFPPPGSRGHYWRDLPHVILNRSTLPWERTALEDGTHSTTDPPWLALLLFNEDAPPPPVSACTLKDLRSATTQSPWFPGIEQESGQHDDDRITVIDVPFGLLKVLLPATFDFDYVCHARRRLAYLDKKLVSDGDQWKLLQGILVDKQTPLADTTTAPDIEQLKPAVNKWRVPDRANKQEYEIWEDSTSPPPVYRFYRVDHETAVVLGNRLPKPGQKNTVHLISLEGRYTGNPGAYQFDFQKAQGADAIRLISLKSWEFFCETESKTFKWIMESLNGNTIEVSNGKLDNRNFPDATIVEEKGTKGAVVQKLMSNGKLVGKIISGNWQRAASIRNGEVLDANDQLIGTISGGIFDFQFVGTINGTIMDLSEEVSSDFRLPIPARLTNPMAKKFLESGFVLLPHYFRQGDRSVSWYHGPLVPAPPQVQHQAKDGAGHNQIVAGVPLPASAADALLFFDQASGLFDVSYAAAWELGRMLMLKNTRLALQLYNWKRRHAQKLYAARHLADYGYGLPVKATRTANDASLPDKISKWFDDVARLKHVPFNYLVPDEQLLPPESLRFFVLDALWVECLRDGAFSIGRVLQKDADKDLALKSQLNSIPTLSGFLLRSEAVAGWPTMRIVGYDAVDQKHIADSDLQSYAMALPILRLEKLSKNVLLGLFDGQAQVVDFRLPPEILHCGFDLIDTPDASDPTATSNLCKPLRDQHGKDFSGLTSLACVDKDTRVIDMAALAAALADSIKHNAPSLLTAVVDATGGNSVSNGKLGAGLFALEMVAGVDAMRFVRQKS